MINKALGIAMMCFFVGFAAMVQRYLGEKAHAAFSRFCELAGIRLNPGKPAAGNKIVPVFARNLPAQGERLSAINIADS